MNLSKAGGIDTLGHGEAICVTFATTGGSANWNAHQITLLKSVEGHFHILSGIKTSRIFVN